MGRLLNSSTACRSPASGFDAGLLKSNRQERQEDEQYEYRKPFRCELSRGGGLLISPLSSWRSWRLGGSYSSAGRRAIHCACAGAPARAITSLTISAGRNLCRSPPKVAIWRISVLE